MRQNAFRAMLLLGPTGSGKTPLGHLLESQGFQGCGCAHFDFGEWLRRIVTEGKADETVSAADIEFLRKVLSTGALLEDKDFPIAERIFRSFCSRREVEGSTLVVLNGIPRHLGQATALERVLRVEVVVCLQCEAKAVYARIAANTGGDRSERSDDAQGDIRRKLAIFEERTAPLIEFYRNAGANVIPIPVTPHMTPPQMWEALQQRYSDQ